MDLEQSFNQYRQKGLDDSQILQGYKEFAPDSAKTIDGLTSKGIAPRKILDALTEYHKQEAQADPEANTPWYSRATKAVRQGIGSTLSGEGETLNQSGYELPGKLLKSAGKFVSPAPGDYTPGGQTVFNSDKSLGARAGAVPYALAEGAPGLAQDLVAARYGAMAGGAAGGVAGAIFPPAEFLTVPGGAILGGLAGLGGSMYARNFGNTAKEAADGRTGKENAEVTEDDKSKARKLLAAETALSAIGLKGALGSSVKGSVREMLPQVAKQVGLGAAADATTSAASDALHQAVIDPSKLTLDHVLASAALGGATGGAIRTVKGAAEIGGEKAKAATFADLDPENGANLAKRFDGKDFKTTKQAFDSVTSVENSLKSELSERQSAMGNKLTSLQEKSGFKDDTHELVADATTKLTKGETLDELTLAKLKERLGDHHEDSSWLDTVSDYNSLNKLKAIGNYSKEKGGSFGGGITGSKTGQAVLNPFGTLNKWLGGVDIAASGLHGISTGALPNMLHPLAGAGYLLAQHGVKSAARSIDSFRGVDNPTQHFMERFGNSEAPTSDTMSKPSFRQEQVEQKARELAAKQAEGEKAKEQATSDSVDARGRKAVSSAMDRVVKENETQAEQAVADKAAAEQKAQTAAIKNAAKVWKLRQSTEKAEADAKAKDSKDTLTQASKSWKIRKNTEAAEAAAQAARERQASADSKALLNNVGASWRIRKNTEVAEAQAQTAQERQSLSDSKALLKNTSASWRLRKASEAAEAATQAKEEASNSAATKAAISNAGRIWKIRQASESASVSDATLALKVAKLKQKYENDRNKFAAQESRVQERQAKTEAKETARQEASAKKDAERKEKQAQRDDALKAKADSKNAKSENAPKAEPKAEKAQADTNVGDMVHVKVGNQTVSKSKDTIRNEAAWKASVHKSMTIRHHVTEAVKKIVGKEHHKDATEMLTRFNNAEGTSRHEAYMAAENFVNKLPEALQGKVFDAIDKPELWSTFKDK